jgi:cob(I)alamin adenosyltransferase
VGLGLLAREDVAGLLEARPAGVHLVLTGRGAWDDLVARADLVTEMRSVKHPYDAGAGAQPGVEF